MTMLKTLRLILIATMGTACFTAAAFAEDAPNCPGGNLKGTIKCTGLINPVCTEGPPWHCEHPPETDPPKATMGGFGGGTKHHFNAIATFDTVAFN
jgi:hypothetical protein